jgi:hypothetical protein
MPDNPNISFEYVFYFLFRRYLQKPEGDFWNEPTGLDFIEKTSSRFEEDKRLFRYDVEREPLEKWEVHFRQSWQKLQEEVYQKAADDPEMGLAYCRQALLGVALVILDYGDSVAQHTVNIAVENERHRLLRFKVKNQSLFHLKKDEQVARFWEFTPMTQGGKPFSTEVMQFHETPTQLLLKPMALGELMPNPVFSVYGFTFGGSQDNDLIDKLFRAPSKRHYLLAAVLTRLIIVQWQFGRIDREVKKLLPDLRKDNVRYAHYANEFQDARPRCASTRQLEYQLQDMQTLSNKATFLTSRIQSALKTIDINGNNLARRLERIQQETPNNPWQLDLGEEKVQWQLETENDVSLLQPFSRAIRRLQHHHTFLETQVKYLNGLQDRWQLYLEQRKMLLGKNLDILGIILVLLGGGGVTLNSKVIVDVEKEWLAWLMVALLVPIAWRFLKWMIQKTCCILHGTRFSVFLCQPIFQWFTKFEIFRFFKKSKSRFNRGEKQ